MTLGVAGTGLSDRDMVKGGNDGMRIAPARWRPTSATRMSQEMEWRCLSFREARMVVTGDEGTAGSSIIGSSEADIAEHNCAASLGKEMVNSRAPSTAHPELIEREVMDDEGVKPGAIKKLGKYFAWAKIAILTKHGARDFDTWMPSRLCISGTVLHLLKDKYRFYTTATTAYVQDVSGDSNRRYVIGGHAQVEVMLK
jgi:hypothetical protein